MRGATLSKAVRGFTNGFQSTLPYAGSDQMWKESTALEDISIHAPLCGERRLELFGGYENENISIHAPLCGERPYFRICTEQTGEFQSTLPYAGSDTSSASSLTPWTNFNPRSPMRGATLP